MTMYDRVEVKYTPTVGRGLFAKQAFSTGDVVVTEKAIISAVAGDNDEESYCWHCTRPLVGTQIIQADERTKEHVRQMGTQPFDKYKASLLHNLRIPKFELSPLTGKDGIQGTPNINFCSPECKREALTNYKELLTRLQTVDELYGNSVMMMLHDRDHSMFNTILKVVARTHGYKTQLPDHMPKMIWSTVAALKSRTDQLLYSCVLDVFPEARKRFTFNEYLKIKSLIRLNAFAGETHPVSLLLKKRRDDANLSVELVQDQTIAVPYVVIAAYGSLCNHSCVPNVEARVIATTRHIDWVALRDIQAGEELTNCYASIKDTAKRKAYLKEEYGFDCTCPLCSKIPSASVVNKTLAGWPRI